MRNRIEKALEEKNNIYLHNNKLVINNLKYKVMAKITEINEKFKFKEGQTAFNELVAENNQETIKSAYGAFEDYNGSISKWINDDKNKQQKTNIINLLDKINKFVSYCDVNALSKDSKEKPFQKPEEKKSIAKAFVRQHSWVKNILIYLKEDKLDNVPHSVRKAIEYFQDPVKNFPILSENHRKKISLHYLQKELDDQFDKELKDKAKEWNDKQENKHDDVNLTYEYTEYIYSNEERRQWDCKVDTTLLESNKNLILTGAPGTGKTYLARQMAKKLTQNKEKNIGFVQFHSSYDYTDFVEGLRPIKDSNGNIVFERKNGIFKEFCKKASEKASEKADENFVFIIDEINRGEISKIFGELFFSIDPGYRGEEGKIKTQYQNLLENTDDKYEDGFFIPENVYIIGTMNDIDRSVESMDFAFRRRFAFQEITAEDTMDSILYELGSDMNDAVNKMRAINSTLDKLGLNSNYHIGAAYFQKVKNSKKKLNKWNDLWNLHLKGTLFEYFRGEPDADNKIEQLKDAYDNANKENNK